MVFWSLCVGYGYIYDLCSLVGFVYEGYVWLIVIIGFVGEYGSVKVVYGMSFPVQFQGGICSMVQAG